MSPLRLRVDGVGGVRDAARSVERCLRGIAGVRGVAFDANAGVVSVLYEPVTSDDEPASPTAVAVRPAGAVATIAAPPVARLVGWLARTVVVVGVELALHRVLGPLFPARRC